MPGWTDLSHETKTEIVNRLDLMSRNALKSCARAERALVDGTDLFLPRVRFVFQGDAALIAAYSSIDRFLRLEFWKDKEKNVVIHRSENDFNMKPSARIPNGDILESAVSVLKSLFAHKNIFLGGLEMELPDVRNYEKWGHDIMRQLVGYRFRARKVIFNWRNFGEDFLFNALCVREDLEERARIGMEIGTYGIEKGYYYVLDSFEFCNADAKPAFSSTIVMSESENNVNFAIAALAFARKMGYARVRSKIIKANFPKPNVKGHKDVKILRTDSVVAGVSLYVCTSACGMWVYAVRDDAQHLFIETFKSVRCGLGWLCKKCSDPFEFAYHRDLARRSVHEPHFTGIMIPPITASHADFMKDVKKLGEAYVKLDKSREKKESLASVPVKSSTFLAVKSSSSIRVSLLISIQMFFFFLWYNSFSSLLLNWVFANFTAGILLFFYY
ncbi:unnamed protein product [Caenorhabditis sp. 36 PRJEB53466]|nr:unnamed protein product [Caenorhabditis sp. 36 PRJEB53466]